MIQTFYGIIAMALVALLMLTMNRSIHANESRMMMNEVSAQVTSIANEFLDQIATLPYDPAMLSDDDSEIAGAVINRGFLTNEITGTANCDLDDQFSGCKVMNDLHGRTTQRSVGGLVYDVEIFLCYVDESNPASSSCPLDESDPPPSPTFSKKAVIRVTSPHLHLGDPSDPLQFDLTRLYSYPRVTG